jgi:hypothetical protein
MVVTPCSKVKTVLWIIIHASHVTSWGFQTCGLLTATFRALEPHRTGKSCGCASVAHGSGAQVTTWASAKLPSWPGGTLPDQAGRLQHHLRWFHLRIWSGSFFVLCVWATWFSFNYQFDWEVPLWHLNLGLGVGLVLQQLILLRHPHRQGLWQVHLRMCRTKTWWFRSSWKWSPGETCGKCWDSNVSVTFGA